jgi:hypothetical protein
MKTPIQKLIAEVEKRISFHSQAQTLSTDARFHMGALQEALWLKEQLLLSLEHERKQIIESCDDALYEPWIISGSDYYQNKYEKTNRNQ